MHACMAPKLRASTKIRTDSLPRSHPYYVLAQVPSSNNIFSKSRMQNVPYRHRLRHCRARQTPSPKQPRPTKDSPDHFRCVNPHIRASHLSIAGRLPLQTFLRKTHLTKPDLSRRKRIAVALSIPPPRFVCATRSKRTQGWRHNI